MSMTAKFVDTANSIDIIIPHSPILTSSVDYDVKENAIHPTIPDDIDPYPVGTTVHQLGGGQFNLDIRGNYRLRNTGEAEYFAYDMLTRLGSTSIGTLSISNKLWPSCIFSHGECEIKEAYGAGLLAYRLSFARSIPNAVNLSDTTVADVPPTFDGRNSLANYAFNSVTIGVHSFIQQITVSRPPIVKHVPRANGVRIKPNRPVRTVRFLVKCFIRTPNVITPPSPLVPTRPSLEEAVHDLALQLSSKRASLVGQGNTFENCFLSSYKPADADTWYTSAVELDFEQELDPPRQAAWNEEEIEFPWIRVPI